MKLLIIAIQDNANYRKAYIFRPKVTKPLHLALAIELPSLTEEGVGSRVAQASRLQQWGVGREIAVVYSQKGTFYCCLLIVHRDQAEPGYEGWEAPASQLLLFTHSSPA